MKIEVDYKLADDRGTPNDKEVATIEIIKGDYKGTKFTFGTIAINEDEENDTATLSFDYKIHNNVQLEGDKQFELVLEKIMNSILEESLKAAEQRYNDERRKENTQAPDS